MASQSRKRPELVAPAGNLEKLKFAVLYGADAVYFGGEMLNLRIQSDNFTRADIEEAVGFCRGHGARSVFLLNSFLHEKDIPEARRYLASIRDIPFDALMVSDPGMIALIRDTGVRAAIHLSTQMSTLNHLSVRFWNSAGVDRIVLGRETTVDEVRMIRENSDAEIEVFVHGSLCVAYSGRCLLSRYLTGRDANRGDCAQPCRWRYTLTEEKRPGEELEIVEYPSGTEILSSMDLYLVEKIGEYIDAGVDAFKIEGRMKSVYYTANTVRIYRHALDHASQDDFASFIPFYREELDLVSHRPYTDDLFNEFGVAGYSPIPTVKKALFLGFRTGTGADGAPLVKALNPIYRNETVEAIFPIRGAVADGAFTVKEIFTRDGGPVDMARPNTVCSFVFNREMGEHAILRRRL
jgi:U32 family peptidase